MAEHDDYDLDQHSPRARNAGKTNVEGASQTTTENVDGTSQATTENVDGTSQATTENVDGASQTTTENVDGASQTTTENSDGASQTNTKGGSAYERETLQEILHHMASAIFVADQGYHRAALLHRIETSVSQYAPRIPEASMNTGQDVLLWTRQGSPLRTLFVIFGGMITLVSLFVTFHAIVISLLVLLAIAGGFLALLFACVTAIYCGALSIAILAVCSISFWASVFILTAAGWIGFFCTLWLVASKIFELGQQFLTVTSSDVENYADAAKKRTRT